MSYRYFMIISDSCRWHSLYL